jgi:hypothetical protein
MKVVLYIVLGLFWAFITLLTFALCKNSSDISREEERRDAMRLHREREEAQVKDSKDFV